jgi:aspartokinase-like uncharacterized kinase
MSVKAVLKIGGSLNRSTGLPVLCKEINCLGLHYPLLVVPGGGEFADLVRATYLRYKLDETTAHYMALLAMDQYGYLLNRLIAGSFLSADLNSAVQAAETGRASIMLPSVLIIRDCPLPHSWRITSDTIAAWIAHKIHCRRLVLIKTVDGLMTSQPLKNSISKLASDINVDQLAEHNGSVDEYLSRFLPTVDLMTWIINGLYPERLSELLETSHTTGTCIAPSAGKKLL